MAGLPPVLNVVVVLLALLTGTLVGLRAHRREPISAASKVLQHSPHLWVVLVAPVLLMGFHATFHYHIEWEWLLPYPVQYFYGPVAWGTVLGCFTYFAGFGGAVFVSTRHPLRRRLGGFVLAMFVVLQGMHWFATHPQPPELGPPRVTPSGLVLQSSRATCVPAAAASLLALKGDPRTEAELAELFGTQIDGTVPSQLVRGMARLGYRERTIDLDRQDVAEVAPPAVLFVPRLSHAMTLLRRRADRIDVWDPETGKVLLLDRKQFDILAQGAHALEFHRDAARSGGNPWPF